MNMGDAKDYESMSPISSDVEMMNALHDKPWYCGRLSRTRDCESLSPISDIELLNSFQHKPWCCVRLSHQAFALFILMMCMVCTRLGINTIGPTIAAQRIKAAHISISNVNVGAINNTNSFSSRFVAVVSAPSLFDATCYASSGKLRVEVDGQMTEVGTIWLPDIHVSGGRDLHLDLAVEVQVDKPDVFGRAGKDFIVKSSTLWGAEISVDIVAWVFGIPVHLGGVPISKMIELEGMAGFSQIEHPIRMEKMTSSYGETGVMEVGVQINLFNPSYMAVRVVPEMHFNVTQRGVFFGLATVSDVQLRPGNNLVSARFALMNNPSNQMAVEEFVLGFMRAEIQPITMVGPKYLVHSYFWQSIMDNLALQFDFEAPKYKFIDHIEATAAVSGLSANASVFNPLLANIVFRGMKLEINEASVDGEKIFLVDTNESRTHIPGQILQPNGTSNLIADISLSSAHLTDPLQLARLIGDAHEGSLVVGVKGFIMITVAPSFELTIPYQANDISCTLKCPVWCR